MPKGRKSQKDKAATKTSISSKENKKNADRPPTRRNLNDTPRDDSKSIDKQSSSEECAETPVKQMVPGCEQHEYLQFSLRITEDIISNDLYGNEEMLQVLNSHFAANKGRLDKDKMLAAIVQLCAELNIPLQDSSFKDDILAIDANKAAKMMESKEKLCICPEIKPVSSNNDCDCITEGQLDGQLDLSDEIDKPRPTPLAQERGDSDDVLTNATGVCRCASDSCVRSECNSAGEKGVVHRCMCGSPSCDPSTCDGSDVVTIEVQESLKPESKEAIVVIEEEEELKEDTESNFHMKYCVCNDDQCIRDRTKTYVQYYDKTIKHIKYLPELVVSHQLTSIEPKRNPTVELSIQTSMDNIPACAGACSQKTQVNSSSHYQINVKSSESKNMDKVSSCKIIKSPSKTMHQKSINKFNDEMCEHCLMEKAKHEGVKSSTRSVCVQSDSMSQMRTQNMEGIPKFPHSLPTCPVTSSPSCNNLDYVIFPGPILIPKDVMKKSNDVMTALTASDYPMNIQQAQATTCSGCDIKSQSYFPSSGYMSRASSGRDPPKEYAHRARSRRLEQQHQTLYEDGVRSINEVWFAKEPSGLRHYNDVDLTPQRDTFLYEDKSNDCQCNSKNSKNLLLGNKYNKYSSNMNPVAQNITQFYPTIATQVSSMDLLHYDAYSKFVPKTDSAKPEKIDRIDRTDRIEKKEVAPPKTVAVDESSSSPTRRPVEEDRSEDTSRYRNNSLTMQPKKGTSYKEVARETEDDLLNKLDNVPAVVGSSDSIDKRIQALTLHIEKYREGEEEYIPNVSRNQEANSRDRGVSIAVDVDIIKDPKRGGSTT